MKKVLSILFIFILLFSNIIPVFAYSFIEYPVLSSDDRYTYDFIIWDYITQKNYYFTANIPTMFANTDAMFNDKYKIYELVEGDYGSYWSMLGDDTTYFQSFNFSNCQFQVSNYDIFEVTQGQMLLLANSIVPTVNWEQLQLQEQKKINNKLIDLSEANSANYNLMYSIYVFIAFAVIVSAGGYVIYIICKPIFYFLR